MDNVSVWEGSVLHLAAILILPLGQEIPQQTMSDARKGRQKLAIPFDHLQGFLYRHAVQGGI